MSAAKVLIVEDNAMNMELALALLEQANCTAIEATTAEEGIELAISKQPQLILMDVSLPGMDGLSAVKVLKGDPATKHIPIIVMTAHAMRGDEVKVSDSGSDGYLSKPFNIREFLQMVSQYATAVPDTPAISSNGGPPTSIPESKKNILIVDDDEGNRDLLEGLLESLGHGSETAINGMDALKRLESTTEKLPDLVLLDVMMPGMNGFEVARAMRAMPPTYDLPIVMATALTSKEDRLQAVEAGANDFISKPIDKTELKVRIASLLKMKEAQDAIKAHGAELEEIVDQRTKDLQQALEEVTVARQEADKAHLDTIYRLAVASEYKDKDTATHIQRVSNYCGLLAFHLNMPGDEIGTLCVASPMHDVGKIGIPDAILLKPGRLTAEEWAVMQEHTLIGARILSGSSSQLLQAGEIIALSHHEKWDGSGYPNGLCGTDIHIWGRICAVADVFDALTSERPYKRAFSNDEALQIMREERERHFDPELLDLFLRVRDEIISIQAAGKNA